MEITRKQATLLKLDIQIIKSYELLPELRRAEHRLQNSETYQAYHKSCSNLKQFNEQVGLPA